MLLVFERLYYRILSLIDTLIRQLLGLERC